jgi:predicted phosphodiesterase
MRLAIISDIHANYLALEAVLADIGRRGADRVICLGDVVLKGPQPKECVDRMRAEGILSLLGNTEASFQPGFDPIAWAPQNRTQEHIPEDYARCLRLLTVEDVEWLGGRPFSHVEVLEGERIDLFHATPEHVYKLVWPWESDERLLQQCPAPETAVAVYGHIHRAFIRWVPGGRLVINPGSVGLPFDGDPRASYLLLEMAAGSIAPQIVRVAYDYERAVRTAHIIQWPGADLFAYTVRTGRFAG